MLIADQHRTEMKDGLDTRSRTLLEKYSRDSSANNSFYKKHTSPVTDPPGTVSVHCLHTFVPERATLYCECRIRVGDSLKTNFSLSWPGHSNNSTLKLMNISRSDNGTVFTCLWSLEGLTVKTNYTLQVACEW